MTASGKIKNLVLWCWFDVIDGDVEWFDDADDDKKTNNYLAGFQKI